MEWSGSEVLDESKVETASRGEVTQIGCKRSGVGSGGSVGSQRGIEKGSEDGREVAESERERSTWER